jgi:hypothetical protein
MASPGGDRGRDAELYSIEGEPNTLFQYSVREDWEQKITETLARVHDPLEPALPFPNEQRAGLGESVGRAHTVHG